MTKIKSSCKTLPRMHYVFVFVFFFNKHLRQFFSIQSPKHFRRKKDVGSFIGEKTYIYNEIMPNPKLKYLQDSP